MGQSSLHWNAFLKEVIKNQSVWTIRDEDGFPEPLNSEGKRAMPFWSTRKRVEKIIETVESYSHFTIYQISLEEFKQRWLAGMKRDSILVGVNWSGTSALGFDIEPDIVLGRLEIE